MPEAKPPLYYTFGNHMHWVDMQWLWGYDVLPGSVQDMLRLIEETGARGNVNFDAVGYEKMAAECPEALASLREAVAAGKVEPVGCSYGQPYGLFHGGESNVRQLTYGVRATRRLLGVRPRAFWEEEFYFFPQLPQMLARCGYTGACLFFQWTWHTPEVPREPHSLVLWEGIDGTRLPALPRNDLNVHQWPEDFDGLLTKATNWQSSNAANGRSREAGDPAGLPPAVVQWLELMPSKDWMCRSEVLLPRLKELMGDPRFEVRARTVSQLIAELLGRAAGAERTTGRDREGARGAAELPVRRYSMDDVWHGMTLGKNADAHPRASAGMDRDITAAEAISSLASLLGRPYASWDLYPAWELDEAWRETLAAQHHDNHECEGLCGFVGHQQFWRAALITREVTGRAAWLIARRAGLPGSSRLRINPLGWPRALRTRAQRGGRRSARQFHVPPFGYAAAPATQGDPPNTVLRRSRGRIVLSREGFAAEFDAARGTILRLGTEQVCCDSILFPAFRMQRRGRKVGFGTPEVSISRDDGTVHVTHALAGGGAVACTFSIAEDADGLDCVVSFMDADPFEPLRPDPGLNAALHAAFGLAAPGSIVRSDSGFCVSVVHGVAGRRKYPTGDWMTSPQWFEEVSGAFTSYSFVDVADPARERGLLICHDGSQQWFRDAAGLRAVLTADDPWDEGRAGSPPDHCQFRLIPHRGLSNAACVRAAAEFRAGACPPPIDEQARPVGGGTAARVLADLPRVFGGAEVCNAPNVLAHAFFRESMKSGEHLPDWAGHRMARESGGACTHPFVIRLVEWDGEPASVALKLPGPVAMAAKTNLLGEVGEHVGGGADTRWLDVIDNVEPPEWAEGAKLGGREIPWSEVRFEMRPREIATLMADLVMGRKQWRDLDAKREVWATVHRVGERGERPEGNKE